VAILGNVDSPLIALEMEGVEAAAKKLGLDAFRLEVRKAEDIVPSIEGLKGAADALYVCSDPFLTTHRVRINTLAVSQKLPTMNAFREYVVAGGPMGPTSQTCSGVPAITSIRSFAGQSQPISQSSNR
jgi:ABC-type uncharacterized transport system substrate-binding protein